MPPASPRASRQAASTERAISGVAGHQPAKNRRRKPLIDPGQPLDVGDRHMLVRLVHGGADQAELDHGAIAREEARVRRAAESCVSSGLNPVSASMLRASSSLSGPGAVTNASALPITSSR